MHSFFTVVDELLHCTGETNYLEYSILVQFTDKKHKGVSLKYVFNTGAQR